MRRIVAALRTRQRLFRACSEPTSTARPGLTWNDAFARGEASDRHLIALNVANGSQRVAHA